MSRKPFLKSNLCRVLTFFFVFLLLISASAVLFIRSLRFYAVPILRALYIGISIVWAVASIWWVIVRFDFVKYWRGMVDDFWDSQEDFERELYIKYRELMDTYPIAIAEYESHCWRQSPRPTNPEMMEQALAISVDEWKEREEKAKARLAEKLKK